ncbi:MAG: hypothetical protein R6W67_03660 [Bacteroidales bacterium]
MFRGLDKGTPLGTNARGIVNELRISFDDKEVVFVRKADARLNDTDLIRKQ